MNLLVNPPQPFQYTGYFEAVEEVKGVFHSWKANSLVPFSFASNNETLDVLRNLLASHGYSYDLVDVVSSFIGRSHVKVWSHEENRVVQLQSISSIEINWNETLQEEQIKEVTNIIVPFLQKNGFIENEE